MENSRAIKGAKHAMSAIAMVAKETPSLSARQAIARAAKSPHGNYTPEAKALWGEYLALGCPRA